MSKRFTISGRVRVPYKPALQNIPVRTELGREIRTAFVGVVPHRHTNNLDDFMTHTATCFYCFGGNEADGVLLATLIDALEGFIAV